MALRVYRWHWWGSCNYFKKSLRCDSLGSAWRLARCSRRPAENLPVPNAGAFWLVVCSPGTSRRDADWCDRDGHALPFQLNPISETGIGSTPAPGVVFRALAENLRCPKHYGARRVVPRVRKRDARRVAQHPRAGVLPNFGVRVEAIPRVTGSTWWPIKRVAITSPQ